MDPNATVAECEILKESVIQIVTRVRKDPPPVPEVSVAQNVEVEQEPEPVNRGLPRASEGAAGFKSNMPEDQPKAPSNAGNKPAPRPQPARNEPANDGCCCTIF